MEIGACLFRYIAPLYYPYPWHSGHPLFCQEIWGEIDSIKKIMFSHNSFVKLRNLDSKGVNVIIECVCVWSVIRSAIHILYSDDELDMPNYYINLPSFA